MEWQVILAVVLIIPIILLPLALVWYLNVSGLYRVIIDARRRQRRRAEALMEVEAARLIAEHTKEEVQTEYYKTIMGV